MSLKCKKKKKKGMQNSCLFCDIEENHPPTAVAQKAPHEDLLTDKVSR
jgi:hypothetical protein